MKLADQFRTGGRNLRRQKLRTVLTVFAIVIGAVSVTVMLTLVTSAKGFVRDQFDGTGETRRIAVTSDPSIDKYWDATNSWSDGSGTRLDASMVQKISGIQGVDGVSGVWTPWNVAAMSLDGTRVDFDKTRLYGIDPGPAFSYPVMAGETLSTSSGEGDIVVSSSVANNLGYAKRFDELVGKSVVFEGRKDAGDMPVPSGAKIIGVVEGDSAAYITLDWATAIATRTRHDNKDGKDIVTTESEIDRNGYNSIWVNVPNKNDIDRIEKEIRVFGVGAVSGAQAVSEQEKIFNIIGAVLGGIGAIALLVAAIGVINTMVMATLERTREIGIMRALGATKRTVKRLFTVEAAILGFFGGVFGVALSFLFAKLANGPLNSMLEDQGFSARDVVKVPAGLGLLVIAVTTGIGVLAGRLPARRAANLDPVEALRYE